MRLGVAGALVRGVIIPGDVEIGGGVIREVGIGSGTGSRIAVPGFVDLQVNGFAGIDFLGATADDFRAAGAAMLRTGVTAYQPTFITSSEATIASALAEMPPEHTFPRVIGAHLEGPFLSPYRLGAHPGHHRRDPDVLLLERLLEAGRVTEMTLAPELPGSEALIRRLVDAGIIVSAGHSDATAAAAHEGFNVGISTVTHLFNAMRAMLSRDPGIVGAALARPDVSIQIIVDRHHLSDETVLTAWAAARGRVALITDATAASASDGSAYQLGDMQIASTGGPPMKENGVLAGTALTMIDAVRNFHSLGVPLAEALTAATATPARILRRRDLGVLEPGASADVVVLDDRLEIADVFCAGDPNVVG